MSAKRPHHFEDVVMPDRRLTSYIQMVLERPALLEELLAERSDNARLVSSLIVCVSGYVSEGQQTFDVGPRLAQQLVRVGRTTPPAEVRLPYPSGYVRCMGSGISLEEPETGPHPLAGFYWTTTFSKEKVVVWSVHAWGPSNENSLGAGDDATGFWHMAFDADSHAPLDQLLAESRKRGEERRLAHTSDTLDRVVTYSLQLLCGLAVYLSCENRDAVQDLTQVERHREVQKQLTAARKSGSKKASKSIEHWTKILDRTPKTSVTIVGHRFEAANSAGGTHATPRLHLVRAHAQRVGHDKHWCWIEVYQRGRGGPEVAREYQVR